MQPAETPSDVDIALEGEKERESERTEGLSPDGGPRAFEAYMHSPLLATTGLLHYAIRSNGRAFEGQKQNHLMGHETRPGSTDVKQIHEEDFQQKSSGKKSSNWGKGPLRLQR